MNKKFYALSAVFLAGVLGGGCVSSEQAQKQIEAADSEAGFNRPENEWKTPFWERGGGQPAAEETQPQASSSIAAKPATGQLRTNVAIVGATGAFYRELDNAAADYGFRLIPRSELQDAIANTPECADTTEEACAEALAAYPGARLVVSVEGGDQVTIVDAASNARWSQTTLTSGKPGEELLELLSQRSDIAPWAMKAFQGDDGRLYLSAGRANGLEAGDELAIHEPGTLVRAPNGQPITWRKGDQVGTVRIGELFGSDLASLLPVDGQRPTLEHDLILIED